MKQVRSEVSLNEARTVMNWWQKKIKCSMVSSVVPQEQIGGGAEAIVSSEQLHYLIW
jgi:hypothetical protein